jgi:hypothetical protein
MHSQCNINGEWESREGANGREAGSKNRRRSEMVVSSPLGDN